MSTDETGESAPSTLALRSVVADIAGTINPKAAKPDAAMVDNAKAIASTEPAAAFRLAQQALLQGRAADARDVFREIVRHHPQTAVAHIGLSDALAATGQVTEASRSARCGAVLAPGDARAWSALCRIQSSGDGREDTEQSGSGGPLTPARRALVIGPDQPGLHNQLGRACWKAAQPEAAMAAARSGLALAPDDPGLNLLLASCLTALERSAEALPHFEKAKADRAAWWEIFNNLGMTHLNLGDVHAAADNYNRLARLKYGRPRNDDPAFDGLPDIPERPVPRHCTGHRLHHDAEQFARLRAKGVLPDDLKDMADAYEEVRKRVAPEDDPDAGFTLSGPAYELLAPTWNRLVHVAGTGWGDRPALNPELDWNDIDATFMAGTPKQGFIDDLLIPEALEALRTFCFDTTMWFDVKPLGYLGAYMEDGFADPLLCRIATELRERMPLALAAHPLQKMWAYKYEQGMHGINPHADFANVNVNFWITDNAANLDPDTGGLIVYPKPAPDSWTFAEYNHAPREEIYRFLGSSKDEALRVPHRTNRAVLFDSRLFHETDVIRFAPGYENRRINITMLYGNGP